MWHFLRFVFVQFSLVFFSLLRFFFSFSSGLFIRFSCQFRNFFFFFSFFVVGFHRHFICVSAVKESTITLVCLIICLQYICIYLWNGNSVVEKIAHERTTEMFKNKNAHGQPQQSRVKEKKRDQFTAGEMI